LPGWSEERTLSEQSSKIQIQLSSGTFAFIEARMAFQ